MNNDKSPLKVLITGSPRSGTSFLANLVAEMGFSCGPAEWLKQPDEHNPRGYFECNPLRKLTSDILTKLGGNFHDLPAFDDNWTDDLDDEKKKILDIVNQGKIELYKENKLLVLSKLFDEIFPDAKWIFIERSVEDTFRSRWGSDLSIEEWKEIVANRRDIWNKSKPSQKALYVDYKDFKTDLQNTLKKIANYLGLKLSKSEVDRLSDLFKPRH